MKSTIKLLAVAALSLAACGDNKAAVDAQVHKDGATGDAMCSNCPSAPMVGAQIDRVGRPAINTALNHGFDPATAKETAKAAYNQASDPSTWLQFVPEFMKNLAIIDALDSGICGNHLCEAGEANVADATHVACAPDCPMANQIGAATQNGCSNQVLYNGGQGNTTPMATSYQTLAGVLADDQLYLDTSKEVCEFYLAVEFAIAISGSNSTCGGRAPGYDVIDFTFSLGALGLYGFSTDGMFTPAFQDGAGPHDDLLPSFPYLGPPN